MDTASIASCAPMLTLLGLGLDVFGAVLIVASLWRSNSQISALEEESPMKDIDDLGSEAQLRRNRMIAQSLRDEMWLALTGSVFVVIGFVLQALGAYFSHFVSPQ